MACRPSPPGVPGVVPGMSARLWLPVAGAAAPPSATTLDLSRAPIVRREEMTGLYVLEPGGRPVLPQVRMGRTEGDRVEVLS